VKKRTVNKTVNNWYDVPARDDVRPASHGASRATRAFDAAHDSDYLGLRRDYPTLLARISNFKA